MVLLEWFKGLRGGDETPAVLSCSNNSVRWESDLNYLRPSSAKANSAHSELSKPIVSSISEGQRVSIRLQMWKRYRWSLAPLKSIAAQHRSRLPPKHTAAEACLPHISRERGMLSYNTNLKKGKNWIMERKEPQPPPPQKNSLITGTFRLKYSHRSIATNMDTKKEITKHN